MSQPTEVPAEPIQITIVLPTFGSHPSFDPQADVLIPAAVQPGEVFTPLGVVCADLPPGVPFEAVIQPYRVQRVVVPGEIFEVVPSR